MATRNHDKDQRFRQKQLLRQRMRMVMTGAGTLLLAGLASMGLYLFKSVDSNARESMPVSAPTLPVELNVTEAQRDTATSATYKVARRLDERPAPPSTQ